MTKVRAALRRLLLEVRAWWDCRCGRHVWIEPHPGVHFASVRCTNCGARDWEREAAQAAEAALDLLIEYLLLKGMPVTAVKRPHSRTQEPSSAVCQRS